LAKKINAEDYESNKLWKDLDSKYQI